MRTSLYQIPFSLFGKMGELEVCYSANAGPVESEFEIVRDLVPDLNICIGYPTLRAYIKDFAGLGFAKYCGWIQTIQLRFYQTSLDAQPSEVVDLVDVPPVLQENGVPFFAYGYPAEMYDAPVNNFSDGRKLIWRANTYFVAMPSFVNGNQIECLAQFRWGYMDDPSGNRHSVALLPFEAADRECWRDDLKLLNEQFPKWKFAE